MLTLHSNAELEIHLSLWSFKQLNIVPRFLLLSLPLENIHIRQFLQIPDARFIRSHNLLVVKKHPISDTIIYIHRIAYRHTNVCDIMT